MVLIIFKSENCSYTGDHSTSRWIMINVKCIYIEIDRKLIQLIIRAMIIMTSQEKSSFSQHFGFLMSLFIEILLLKVEIWIFWFYSQIVQLKWSKFKF